MNKVAVIISALICMGWTIGCTSKKEPASVSTPQWVESLNEIPLPDYLQCDSLINVYFKYNQTVNGYEVTARWMPYDQRSETGLVIMNFRNKDTGDEFHYFGEKYNSFDTDDITFTEDFKGHKSGDVHYFNYTSPDTFDHFKHFNDNSPLGYYTSFQFLDIDFDGNDELLVSDMYKGQPGNDYGVFKRSNNSLQKLDYIPLDRLTNVDRINLKKKTITIVDFDGAYDKAEFFFSFKKRNVRIKHIPKFYSVSASRFEFDKYNSELGSPFVLDSIKEYSKADVEHCVSYKVDGNRIIKEYELKDRLWSWHFDGGFKYPYDYHCSKTYVDDVPAEVEVISKGNIQLCYWSLLGMWSTHIDFPEEGVFLSPTEKVKDVVYRSESKRIASGYTQNGNVYYLKQKIMPGAGADHSKVLVLIYPQSEKKKVKELINIVANW